MKTVLYQITSTYFTAGVEVENQKVVAAAPIIRYMKGWDLWKLKSYCATKRWGLLNVDLKSMSAGLEG